MVRDDEEADDDDGKTGDADDVDDTMNWTLMIDAMVLFL